MGKLFAETAAVALTGSLQALYPGAMTDNPNKLAGRLDTVTTLMAMYNKELQAQGSDKRLGLADRKVVVLSLDEYNYRCQRGI